MPLAIDPRRLVRLPDDDYEAEQRRLLATAQQPWPQGPSPDAQLDIEAEAKQVLDPLPPLAGYMTPEEQALRAQADSRPLPVDESAAQEPPLPTVEDGSGEQLPPAFDATRLRRLPDDEPARLPAPSFDPSRLRRLPDEPVPSGFDQEKPVINVQPAEPAPTPAAAPEVKLGFGGAEAAIAEAAMRKPVAPPVTTPEAEDGSDVTFAAKDVPFKFTGHLEVDPGTGPMGAYEPSLPQGPLQKATPNGSVVTALNQAPRLVPRGGKIVFDQSSEERFTQGVDLAYQQGLLPEENYQKIKANAAAVYKVVDDRRKLEAKAKVDPTLLAALHGLGRGGAATLGAVGGSSALAPAGLLTGPAAPIAVPALGVVGAIGGGIGAALAYDAIYKQLGKHFDQYDTVMKAAELYPQYDKGGELAMAAVALPVSLAQGARGLATAYQAGGLPAAAGMAGKAAALGAGTGAVAYPIDAAVRGEPITAGGMAQAAGAGALMGGFFINGRVAKTGEFAAVAAKMKAGMKLTAAETALAKAAQPEISARLAEMEAAGGVRTGPMQVEAPTASVAGFSPVVGRARVQVPYEVPSRLPAPSMRAEPVAPVVAPELAPGAAGAVGAVARPTQAPVNVLSPGTTPIAPPTAAMLGIDEFLARQVGLRGIDVRDDDALIALFNEHKAEVQAAVDREEPVAIAALKSHQIDVPYYVPDEATGLATFDPVTYKDWSEHMAGQGAEAADDVAEGGIELLKAIEELGGIPAPKSGQNRQNFSGELKSLFETAKGAGKFKGSDNQTGVFINKLFRKNAMELDRVQRSLRERGFQVETPNDLIELLDRRLRTGREVFGYGALADPQYAYGRRPQGAAPGTPRQMDLLGQDQGGFQLVGQTDKTSLTPAEQAAAIRAELAKAQAAAAQGDLFGGGAERMSGGGATVPPGAPAGGPTVPRAPSWVYEPAETSAGRRLVKGIENYKPGQRWGWRTIVDHVNRAVRLEMRRSTSQTSARHPAHYRPRNHLAYTNNTQSQVNFHEAGHGLEELILSRAPKFFDSFAGELIALTKRAGSMASSAPASGTPAQKLQYELGEGVAEWTRLLMMEPSAVQNLKVTAAINTVAEQYYPDIAKTLRDGTRAVNAFYQSPVEAQWSMFNSLAVENPSASEIVGKLMVWGEQFVNAVASGAPLSAIDRRIRRSILSQRKETGQSYGAAVKQMRRVAERNLTPLLAAYNSILGIGQEVQLAISGVGPSKGLRAAGPDGNYKYFTTWTWSDLRHRVPASKVDQFDAAAWALESVVRWESGRLEYPGMREGMSPEDLWSIVKQAQKDMPGFGQMFAEQSNFQHAVLEMKEFGGLLAPGERQRIINKRPTYWPLPKVMSEGRGRGGKGLGTINKGVYGARGSGEAIRQVDEVTEERVREAMEAYYWNRYGLMLADNLGRVAVDRSLPMDARAIAGQAITRLKMPNEIAATVSKSEVLPWVMDAILDVYEKFLGYRPDNITADDINLSWNFKDVWRPAAPKDVNVVSLIRDGRREFHQLGDRAVFMQFANPQTARTMARTVQWALGPARQNWKRNITQSMPFAIFNLVRDTLSQTVMNPDAVGWLPGLSHSIGLINKFTKKYPQVFQEGLLLSRIEPTDAELVKSVKQGAVWSWFTEGLYVSQAKDPVTRLLATVLQPSNILFPAFKLADLANLIAPGAVVGTAVGGPLGGLAGAVIGPAVGFTGPRMAQFFEEIGREGAAVAALKRGATDEEALMKYWTAAGQFNEHSGVADIRVLMSIPGFLNPQVQGLRNVAQRLTDPDPGVAGTAWARMMMMPALFTLAGALWYATSDRKKRDKERERTLEDRIHYMDVNGFRVPFPFGPEGALASLAYNATLDDLLGRQPRDGDKTAGMLLRMVADPGSPFQFFGPQITPLLEAGVNFSFFRQRSIVAPWMAGLPASQQYYSSTPEFYRKAGQILDYSPAKLQYIVSQGISRQVDETIRFMESLDGGRPISEPADIPFVGRLFTRDPLGFNSQSARDLADVDQKMGALTARLQAKGWGFLGKFDRSGNPEYPPEKLGTTELRNLQMQLGVLQSLKRGIRVIDDINAMAKAATLKRDYAAEKNYLRAAGHYTQSLLSHNEPELRKLETALELLDKIEPASPEQQSADYLQRRF